MLKTSLSASPDPELKSRAARGDHESAKPVGRGLRRLPPCPSASRASRSSPLTSLPQPAPGDLCLQDGLTPLPGDPYGGNTGRHSPAIRRAPAPFRHWLSCLGASEGPRCSPTPRRLSTETAGGPMRSSVGRDVSGPQSRSRRKTEWITLSREAWGSLTAVRDRVLFTVASAPTQG